MKAYPQSILTGRVYAMLAGFFIVAAVLYGLALELTSGWQAEKVWLRVLLDYGLKALLSLPILYVAFVAMRKASMSWRMLLVLALAVPYAFIWRTLYYLWCDSLGIGHLGGEGIWWDIYIPLLVYAWQFAALFAIEYHANSVAASTRASEQARAAVTSELTALRAQINPHFLYNTYNAISASLPPELETTRELLARLAGMFRYQLKVSQDALVPLTDELNFVEDYLSLERVRMGDRLLYDIIVDEEITYIHFPPLVLQPILENAIKHGLSPKLAGGTLTLSITKKSTNTGQKIHVAILDDGIGMLKEDNNLRVNGTGVGLANTRKRLSLQFGEDLQIAPSKSSGTQVSFSLPLEQLQQPIVNQAIASGE